MENILDFSSINSNDLFFDFFIYLFKYLKYLKVRE